MSPAWMIEARSLIGLREIKGPRHESRIVAFWDDIKCGWFTDDETPWCAGFVGHCLEKAGIRSSRSAAARSYEKWGVEVSRVIPAHIPYGAVVVLDSPGRGAASGHVGFYAGPSGAGFALLAGNQDDAVNVAPFLWSRIVAVRWPENGPAPTYVYPPSGVLVASTSDA